MRWAHVHRLDSNLVEVNRGSWLNWFRPTQRLVSSALAAFRYALGDLDSSQLHVQSLPGVLHRKLRAFDGAETQFGFRFRSCKVPALYFGQHSHRVQIIVLLNSGLFTHQQLTSSINSHHESKPPKPTPERNVFANVFFGVNRRQIGLIKMKQQQILMESTNFESNTDYSKEKIESVYESSNILSHQSYEETQQEQHDGDSNLSESNSSIDFSSDGDNQQEPQIKEQKREEKKENERQNEGEDKSKQHVSIENQIEVKPIQKRLEPQAEGDQQEAQEKKEASLEEEGLEINDQQNQDEQPPPLPSSNNEDDQDNISELNWSEESLSDQEPPIEDQEEQIERVNITQALEEEQDAVQDEQQRGQEQEKPKKASKYQISLRPFQTTLIQNSRDRNSIIYLPTGTGKTRISICSMYYYLCKYGTSKKIVFLANTIQLVKQQAQAIKVTLQAILCNENFARDLRQRLGNQYIQLNWKVEDLNSQVICIHGERSQDQTTTKRKRIQSMMTNRKTFLQEMKKATITVMISQMFLNCLRRGYIKLTDYSFVVFDECHHCRGDHPYSGIMKEFYFDQKAKNRKLEEQNRLEDKDRLPIIMGLTASPVSQPFKEYKQLTNELRRLCVNLDSNFAVYPFSEMATNQTLIQIVPIQQKASRQQIPDLIDFFERYKEHSTSYDKIKTHFPNYFKCVKEVIQLMASRHPCLCVDVDGSRITDPELYLFYDIKECLLLKLRDLWLELGEYAFVLGFHKMILELGNLDNLRSHENAALLKEVIELLKHHCTALAAEYGRCQPQFLSSKVNKLIEILRPSAEDLTKQKASDMVLVFAFKRRTVKFLQQLLDKYRNELPEEQKSFYKSTAVTGYASRQKVYRGDDGHSYQSNPSEIETEAAITKFYAAFEEKEREMASNRVHLEQSLVGEGGDNRTLNNQMARMYFSKMGKVLLQVEEKYSNQIRKIVQFKRKESRVLITTSVTEEGFDIPGCNLVISFDTPFSLKSYIQIKGRARKKNSRYVIFTTEKSHKSILEHKAVYDNTINAIYQLAINQIAKEGQPSEPVEYSPSYKKVATRGGALLNTNYALELLKSYFTSLKQPNRPYFHFVETTNICFKCIIKFPQSSICSRKFIVGNPFSSKLEALRSAAFEAVVVLKKENFIRDDLRPSRLQELEDELELEKYDDLGLYHKDAAYREIFDRYVQIEQCEDPHSKRRLVRFYFRTLDPLRLEFPALNPDFSPKRFEAGEAHTFQLYQIRFANVSGSALLTEGEQTHELGVLTCFSREETGSLFAGFRQRLEPTSAETFQLKLLGQQMMTLKEYQYLKGIHNFLLAGEKNNEIDYYNDLNHQVAVLNPNWTYHQTKKVRLRIDPARNYFPLLVLLRRNKVRHLEVDTAANKHIQRHIDLFKKVYSFHNKPARHVNEKPFQDPLKEEMQVLQDKIKTIGRLGEDRQRSKKYLLQALSKEFCFHKGFPTALSKYDKSVEAEEQKKKRGKLKPKFEKAKKMFTHFQAGELHSQQLVKVELWKQASKDDIVSLLSKDLKVRLADESRGTHRFLKEFVLYPLTYPTMVRISLALKYVFPVLEDFSIALYFRKFYLRQIFQPIAQQRPQPYRFNHYRHIVAQNFEKVLRCMEEAGKSRYVRELGKLGLSSLHRHINIIDPSIQSLSGFDQSLIPNDITDLNISQSHNQILSNSLNQSAIIQESPQERAERRKAEVAVDLRILENLKVEDILRSLTSKIYKHQKSENYEEFEFIGDVVLKFLATLQIFLERTSAEEGEMHIGRANLICNANLHRAAIKKRIFLYAFTTKKRGQPAPIIKETRSDRPKQEKTRFPNTDIEILGPNDDDEGYQYIPGKVHADIMEAIIGIFYLKNKRLNDCQTLLYAFGILHRPSLHVEITHTHNSQPQLPECYRELERRIGYVFRQKGLLVQALTHPTFLEYIEDSLDENQSFSRLLSESVGNEKSRLGILGETSFDNIVKIKKQETFYERLEFLGDAFLDLLVVEYLYDKGGEYINDQGTLSFLKQSAVSNKTLGFIALKLGLHELILMNLNDIDATIKDFRSLSKTLKGMPTPLEFSKLKIGSLKVLGDVFESLIGAILVDNEFSYEATKEVIMSLMEPYIRHFTDLGFVEQSPNYKYKEYLDQNNYKRLKVFKVVQEGIINGEYLYRFSDKSGNLVERELRASNDKDAWDKFFDNGPNAPSE